MATDPRPDRDKRNHVSPIWRCVCSRDKRQPHLCRQPRRLPVFRRPSHTPNR